MPAADGPTRLTEGRAAAAAKIDARIEKAQELVDRSIAGAAEFETMRGDYYTWDEYNRTMLDRMFTTDEIRDSYISSTQSWAFGGSDDLNQQYRDTVRDIEGSQRKLASIKDQLELFEEPPGAAPVAEPVKSAPKGEDIFIVHGHDGEVRETTARFLERITGRAPTILHEKPNKGMTIIEKFEAHGGTAGFAVVLLTGDDVGGVDANELSPRGRQNVVFELGFFVGALGRDRVAVLYEHGVELPSDINGLLYTSLDAAGGWKLKLANELAAAGVEVDATKLLG